MGLVTICGKITDCFVRLVLVLGVIAFFPGIPPNLDYTPIKLNPRKLEGVLAINNKLDGAQKLFLNDVKGPEHIEVYNNEIYVSTHLGYIQKVSNGKIKPVIKFGRDCDGIWQEEICGRPLGFKFSNGSLFVTDAYYGVIKADIKTGKFQTLVSMNEPISGKKPMVPNGLDVAKNGLIFWSDSSTELKLSNGLIMVFGNPMGRVLMTDPVKKETTVLIDKVNFPNGVQLSDDESFLMVSETFRSRILRYYLTGKKAGQWDVLVDNLPGYPDNIHKFKKGTYIVSLVMPHDPIVNALDDWPIIRRVIARLLFLTQQSLELAFEWLPFPQLEKAKHLLGHFELIETIKPPSGDALRATSVIFNLKGEIIESLHAVKGQISHISSVVAHDGYYYLGSPYNPYLGKVKIQ